VSEDGGIVRFFGLEDQWNEDRLLKNESTSKEKWESERIEA
jgi:hypothetical protein